MLINRPRFKSGNVTWIYPFFFLSIAGNFLLGLIIHNWYFKLRGGIDLKWVLIWGQLCMPKLILIWIFERYKLDISYKIHCKCLQGKPIYLQVNIYFWMLQGNPIAIIFVENIYLNQNEFNMIRESLQGCKKFKENPCTYCSENNFQSKICSYISVAMQTWKKHGLD